MRLRLLIAILVVGPLVLKSASLGAESSATASESGKKDTFWFIPHTHWEGAVFKTREEYLQMGLPNILKALRLLGAHPNYRFVLDQACYIKPFLERYPEEEAAFRRFVAEGRLQIVGGTDVMLDVNMPGGESFVRQVLYGKGYCRAKLGVDVTVGWQLDTFGHHVQMPQLLKLAGYKSFWFFRGVASREVPSEFLWQGIDGSRIPAFWTPHGYAMVYGSPKTLPEFAEFFKARFDLMTPFARGTHRVGLAGADVCVPEEHVPALVEEFNKQSDAPFNIRIGVPTDFEAVTALRSDLPVIKGTLNPIFQGAYSSRIELKQWTRELERLLTTAEKLGVLVNRLGKPTDEDTLWRAWEPMLFNQAHDLMSGVMTDKVYDDTLRGYRFSKSLADELLRTRMDGIISMIDTGGDGVPVVVFNALAWPRTDFVEVEVGFSESGILDVGLVDHAGQSVPVQVIQAQRYGDGGLAQAKIGFVAREVPGLGYSMYHVVPLRSAAESKSAASPPKDGDFIENEHYRVSFDVPTGAMKSVVVKPDRWEALSGPANVVTRQEDKGDLWELYRSLDGGSRIAMTRRQPVPTGGQAQFSNEFTGEDGSVSVGPVFSEYKVSHPFGEKGAFSTTVRLYAGVRRIDVRTQILNNHKHVRYQALFPTSIEDGRSTHEIPFGAIERPAAIEFPAQNWVDYGSGKKGVALLNRGLPGNIVTGRTMMLSLMRSTRIVSYGYQGGYEKGMSSDSGFELGKRLTFDYALVPHGGDWRQASVYRHGLEFNNPLIAHKAAPHSGSLPRRWGLLEVSHPNVVLSALRGGEGGRMILRVYEASGSPAAAVKIKLHTRIVSAHEANLMEDPGARLAVTDDTLQFDLAPFQIKTLQLQRQFGGKGK